MMIMLPAWRTDYPGFAFVSWLLSLLLSAAGPQPHRNGDM